MEAGGSVRFGQGVAAGPVHLGGGGGAVAHQVMPGAGMIPAGMSSLLLGAAGMPPPVGGNMVQPSGGYLAPAGYGSVVPNLLRAAWSDGVAVGAGGQQQQQPRAGGAAGNGVLMRPPPPHRGPWTEEEDQTLKAMVDVYGERKWAAVSKHLPGRIGKQCRERWTNHLRPDIDKNKTTWTQADDEQLIRAHKVFGNRWSLIARELGGRSENSVKNHWNATKRSLKAKRRLKKKKNAEAPPGQQWSLLEQYIRSLPPDGGAVVAADDAAEPQEASDSPPSSYNTGYGGEVVSPPAPAVVPPPAAGFDPGAMGLYLSASGNNYSSSSVANLGAMNMNPDMAPPSFLGLDINAAYYYYSGAAMQATAAATRQPPAMMPITGQGHAEYQQAAASSYANNDSLITYPFVDNMAWSTPAASVHADAAVYAGNNTASAAAHYPYYYFGSDAGAGPSGAAGNGDDVDVVQMASREFQMTPSEEEVTLNLAGFM